MWVVQDRRLEASMGPASMSGAREPWREATETLG